MMDSTVKLILEKYIKLIDLEEWDYFFEVIQADYIPQTVNKVANVLKDAGIYPIPKMTFIPEGYYMLCSASEITIPNNIERIRYKAFTASDIEQITIPGNVYDIGQYAFEGCDFLRTVVFEDGVKYIEDAVFYACDDLTEVHLPKSLESIGHNVFNSCDNLLEVHYAGTIEDWRKVKRHEFLDEGSYISKVICSDGSIEL